MAEDVLNFDDSSAYDSSRKVRGLAMIGSMVADDSMHASRAGPPELNNLPGGPMAVKRPSHRVSHPNGVSFTTLPEGRRIR